VNKQHATVTGELQYTKTLLDNRAAEWNAAVAELTTLEVEIANVTKELKQVKAEEHDAEAHEKYLEELAAKEAKQAEALQALQAKENEETEALNKRANEEREKLHALDDELKKSDKELQALNREIKEKEVEIEHLGGHVEEFVRRKIPPIHSDYLTHTNLVVSKETLVTKVVTDLGVILERIPVETGEKEDLLKTYNVHYLSLTQIKERIVSLEHDITDINNTKQSVHDSYTQAIEAHKAETERLDAANATYAEVGGKLKAARKENDILFAEINDLKAKIKVLAAEEAKTEEAEAELAAKANAEAAEIAALRAKEKQEREAIAALKKSLAEAKHLLREHETYGASHKQTLEKLNVDFTDINTNISTRETEITGVLTEHEATNQQYIETGRNIDTAGKRLQVLEVQEASMKHLETDLDEKIKEIVHKEATEHQVLEDNRVKIRNLSIELDHIRCELVKSSAALSTKNKEYEIKVAAAQKDIKTYESEFAVRADVHKQREKDVVAFEARAKRHSQHDRKKKKEKKLKKRANYHHHKRRNVPPSSSSSSSSDWMANNVIWK